MRFTLIHSKILKRHDFQSSNELILSVLLLFNPLPSHQSITTSHAHGISIRRGTMLSLIQSPISFYIDYIKGSHNWVGHSILLS